MSDVPIATKTDTETTSDEIDILKRIEDRLLWLSSWTIHHANHIRPSRDGLKVGGHQASSASMTGIMAALYFGVLTPQDRVAVKPHASPVFHAVQYLLGRQTRDQLERFRALGGAQSYPSRTKDIDDVDFSTGSVGLGVAITAFASIVQDYLAAKNRIAPHRMGRMISILGDAELDEGNIYECLIEAVKHNLRNCWWIIDYNRQSLDATSPDRMSDRFQSIFEACDWDVVTIKYGRKLREAFERPGGKPLKAWIEACPNDLYAALSFEGGKAWREQLLTDIGSRRGVKALLSDYDDDALSELMSNLGGHCIETLLEAFREAEGDETPKLFVVYTIKGYRLPFQGHKDNHAGLMNPTQMDTFRAMLGVAEGDEWDPFAGLNANEAERVKGYLEASAWAQQTGRRYSDTSLELPSGAFKAPDGAISTQAAFGKILHELSKTETDFADRLVTMSPDVTVSTNLGGFVNRRGLFGRTAVADVFKERKLASAQMWQKGPQGQHIELGIAENNLFLCLGAFGLSESLFGTRLLPVGTLYDPFISRGLDALNYACYQGARFMLVATPSGVTLGPEGGAHQSLNTPLIGMGQPGLVYLEPAFADELALQMRWGFEHMQAKDGCAVYLRLSTRSLTAPERLDHDWQDGCRKGAYWLRKPTDGAELAIVYCGAIAPEAMAAHEALLEDSPGAGLLAVTSPDLLHADWARARRQRWTQEGEPDAWIERLLAPLSAGAGLVTVMDGSPAALSWIGGVKGHRVRPLGTEAFGQTGDLPDLYRIHRLDADAIHDACADLFLP